MASKVTLSDGAFHIDGTPTYAGRSWRGHRIEGRLFDSRMANAIADDENPETRGAWAYADGPWDAQRSTAEFIAALPAYRAHGLLAVCINLSGGSPQGYSWNQPWKICGFTPDGTIKHAWAERLEAVIAACDRLGMVVILGLFYGKQSGTFKDESAVKAAVTNTVDWLSAKGATNVLLEIGNEVDLENVWTHPIIAAERCHELIELAQRRSGGRLLVSTSLIGIDAPPEPIVAAADFLLPHGNRVHGPDGHYQPSPHGIRLQLARWRASPAYRGQPIVYNEDDHFEFDKPDNHFVAAVECGASWGYFDYRMSRERFEDGFQSLPVDWTISSKRKRAFFGLLKEITGA
ncbi:MAG: hypothetical protein J0J01_11460 [Reyranella sp.]|uniref:hypothetical protein n=1 Tax=Reyranella sp. TaxID=1929291 RepID=UPI001ACC4D97|nr:hypothetical protein [Reyranella sp.]MBN9087516.1 hypothetical protein [Reyranella sp.]